MSEAHAFGSLATTIVFAVAISLAGIVIAGLSFVSTRGFLRSTFGIYDPVFKSRRGFSSNLNPNSPVYVIHPYVIYKGMTYLMYGNANITGRRIKVKKLEVLTLKQLEDFFPLQTYKDWLDGGKEEVNERNKNKVGYMETFETDSVIEIVPSNIEEFKEDAEHTEMDITEMKPEKRAEYSITSPYLDCHELQKYSTTKHYTSGICAICLEDLQDEDQVRGLLCGHVFHKLCIDPWLTHRKGYCPTCKKDLYIEVNKLSNEGVDDIESNTDQSLQIPQSETVASSEYEVSNLITLDDATSDAQNLDFVFNIHPDNLLAFFVVSMLTKIKAETILIALLYNRNNITHIDTDDSSIDNEVIEVNISSISQRVARANCEKVKQYFNQPNDEQSGDKNTPPLPDLSRINPLLKRVVEHRPSLFNPVDLNEIDHRAWKETKRMRRGFKILFFKIIGVSKINLYYYNVVRIYQKRQYERLHHTH